MSSEKRLAKLAYAVIILLIIDVAITVMFNAISGSGNLMDGLWILLVAEGLIMMAICLALLTSSSKRMRAESLYFSSVGNNEPSKGLHQKVQSDEVIAILFGGMGFIFVFVGTVIAG
ncbi:MAG: hypothetical protein QXE18_03960 [Thermoplasmata archaeon]